MANPVPNALSLNVIQNGTLGDATPVESNFTAIQSAVNLLRACLANGVAGNVLQAVDGTDVQWGIASGQRLASGQRTSNVSTTGTTFAAGADLLSSPLSFTADGTSSYVVRVSAELWLNGIGGSLNILRLNLDGADAGIFLSSACDVANANYPCQAAGVVTPAAGAHTVNVRLTVSASTGTIAGGSGGAGAALPILVTVEKL